MNRPAESRWYISKDVGKDGKKDIRTMGPFSVDDIHKLMVSNWINVKDDFVSMNGELFEPIHQVPELIPDAILDTVGRWVPDPEWESK